MADGRLARSVEQRHSRSREEGIVFKRLRVGPVIVAVALAAGVVPAAGAGTADGPDHQLLQTFEPVLVFHPQESLRPTKVQSFVADSELERFTGTSQQQLPLDAFWTVTDPDPEPGELGSLPAGLYRLDQTSCHANASLADAACYAAAWAEGSGGDAVYGRVVRTETRIVLQYWLFYYDNPLLLPSPLGTFWQSHEGDWEVVNVVLGADGQPLEAAYSQHCTGQRRAWAGVEKQEGTHPVAYVALGSHANFFEPLGLVPISCRPAGVPPLPFIVDRVAAGPTTETTIHAIEGMEWSEFQGFWGETEYFFTPVPFLGFPAGTAIPAGTAPATPPLQPNWDVNTVLGWPSS
jgi:hypothetical protein